MILRAALALLACLAPLAAAAAPLTLEQALAAAEASHPDLELALAERDSALAEQDLAGARSDLLVTLDGGVRRVQPTANGGQRSDNSVRLNARKNLYDFGRSGAAEQAARSVVEAREASLLDVRARRRLEVMAHFFEVLAADLQYTAENEFMAVAYVNADNGRHRKGLGLLNPSDLAELEHHYQETLVKRNAAMARQRAARAQLANAMGQPGKLTADLADPALPGNDRALPELEDLQPLLDRNPRLVAQRSLLEASRQRLAALRAESYPTLDAEVEAANYSRAATTRDDLRAGILFNWPLYQGRRTSAQVAREQARFHSLQAETDKLAMDLQQALLELWLEIGQLQRAVRAAAKKEVEYRDLALEKARAQYDLELRANLGTSMAATMEAKLRERRTEYRLALAFARLEALLGGPLDQTKKESTK